MAERSLGVRETPGSIPGSPNRDRRTRGEGPRVVFVYSDRPSGHSAAAACVAAALRRLDPSVSSEELSLASDLHPVLGPLVSAAYLETLKLTPRLWDYLYDNEAVAAALRELRELLSVFHRRKLALRLARAAPAAVVCTHALPCATLAIEREAGRLAAPLVAVPTDFGVHAYWISPWVDLYLAPGEEAAAELARRGVDPARVRLCGIPVDPRFKPAAGKAEARRALGMAPRKPTVLVAGGSKGLGPMRDTVTELLRAAADCQVLVVCGTNRALRRGLAAKFRTRRLKTLGYTRRMPDCFAAADLLIGKPGGVTAAEAAASGLPMILVDPLPGQEERNASRLLEAGAAVRADDQEGAAAAARDILRSARRLAAMRAAALAAARPDSARSAAQAILELATKPR